MTDAVENDILNNQYSLFQQVLYGGVSHGVIIIPTNFFKLLFTMLFPPLGEIISAMEGFITDTFPWVTWEAIKHLFDYQVLTRIIYSLILTSLFYIPGLIYTLSKLTINSNHVAGTLQCNLDTGKCDDTEQNKN